MKTTLDIDSDMLAKLRALADEVARQDNHATGKPYLFQVRTDNKIWDSGLNGHTKVLVNEDFDEVGEFTQETVDQLIAKGASKPDWYDNLEFGLVASWEAEDWLKEQELNLNSYSIENKLQNGFLTAKACQSHIDSNSHHYDNPTYYLSHAFRNPELALIFTFLESLQTGPL